MKRYFWFQIAKSFWYIGDKSYSLMLLIDTQIGDDILYFVYNFFMVRSMDISDKHNLQIWHDE